MCVCLSVSAQDQFILNLTAINRLKSWPACIKTKTNGNIKNFIFVLLKDENFPLLIVWLASAVVNSKNFIQWFYHSMFCGKPSRYTLSTVASFDTANLSTHPRVKVLFVAVFNYEINDCHQMSTYLIKKDLHQYSEEEEWRPGRRRKCSGKSWWRDGRVSTLKDRQRWRKTIQQWT